MKSSRTDETPSANIPPLEIVLEKESKVASTKSTQTIFDRFCCVSKQTGNRIYQRFFPVSEITKARFTFFHQTVLGINLIDKSGTCIAKVKNGLAIAGQLSISTFFSHLAYSGEENPYLAFFLALFTFASTSKTLGTIIRSASFMEQQEAKQIEVDSLIKQMKKDLSEVPKLQLQLLDDKQVRDKEAASLKAICSNLQDELDQTSAQVATLKGVVGALKIQTIGSSNADILVRYAEQCHTLFSEHRNRGLVCLISEYYKSELINDAPNPAGLTEESFLPGNGQNIRQRTV